jgi:prepilin-type processing-associated H-X9-DG protein
METAHTPLPQPARDQSAQKQRTHAGFSQIDLLTVIGVLLLLCLLLTPAPARTRVTDHASQCRNNLRQLIHGWQMYAEDHRGSLPNCFDWVRGALSYAVNNLDNTNMNYLVNSQLGPYVKNPTVYKCPADMSQALEGGVRLPRVRTVSMSQSFCEQSEGSLETDYPGRYRHYLKSADMVLPAPVSLWVMIDESPDSINDGAFAVRMDPYGGIWQDLPSTLHDGGCCFAFADGHSEGKSWTDQRTRGLKITYSGFHSFPYGLAEPNNQDIKWLQDRTSVKK